ncbi:hypothetical protein ACOMHN_048598 [Nucella lapillus]
MNYAEEVGVIFNKALIRHVPTSDNTERRPAAGLATTILSTFRAWHGVSIGKSLWPVYHVAPVFTTSSALMQMTEPPLQARLVGQGKAASFIRVPPHSDGCHSAQFLAWRMTFLIHYLGFLESE